MRVVKHGKGYRARIYKDGKHVWLPTCATEAEAYALGASAQINPVKDRVTVAQWAQIWLNDYARPARSTQTVYKHAVRQVVADLGTHRLDEVTRPMARRFCLQRPYNTGSVACSMFADAFRDEIIDRNPFERLGRPQSRGRKDITALTPQEIDRICGLARACHGDYGDEAAAIITTLAYTGVRPGELCALRWENVLDGPPRLHVRRSVDTTGVEKLPKNGKERIVQLAPLAVEALQHVVRVLGDPYIFHSPTGRRLNKSSINYIFRPVRERWKAEGGDHIVPYHLRHACATMLRDAGLQPSDVALQLGHSDGGILVATRYGHPNEDAARDRINGAFAGIGQEVITQRRKVA
jgi:integrase